MTNHHHSEISLTEYFDRIGYRASPRLDLETLTAIHRAHLTAIAYENLDIHLGRRLSLDLIRTFDKIVRRGRGGWCYEMNLLLGWALRELGFDVTTLGAAVGVRVAEDRQHLDHMTLMVMLDEPWLLDGGFGNAFLEPLPLREGTHQEAGYTFQLQRDGDYWCFKNYPNGGPGFDFLLQPRTIEAFGPRCHGSQTAPESRFAKVPVCHRRRPDHSVLSLRGAVLATVTAEANTTRVIDTLADYRDVLTQTFGLRLSEAEAEQLWAKIWPAHLAWVAAGG
jgi:N-hydroxyarylamine O-acetyltransferase